MEEFGEDYGALIVLAEILEITFKEYFKEMFDLAVIWLHFWIEVYAVEVKDLESSECL